MVEYDSEDKLEIATAILKGLGSGFSLGVCVCALVYFFWYKLYETLLHRLFLTLLVSSLLFSFSIFFESFVVNVPILTDDFSGTNIDNATQQKLCTTAGAMFHYSTLVDILVIMTISLWLVRAVTKTRRFSTFIDKMEYKERIRQKYLELAVYLVLFFLPFVFVLPSIVSSESYAANEANYCRIQLDTDEADNVIQLDTKNLIIAIFTWYVPLFLIMIIVTIILAFVNVKLFLKLRKSPKILKGSHSDILKDAVYLSIFLLTIYIEYLIIMFTSLYYLRTSSQREVYLWIFEAVATVIRGVSILVMFCNPRMRKKVSRNTLQRKGNEKLLQNEEIEPKMTTPIYTSEFEELNPVDMDQSIVGCGVNVAGSFDERVLIEDKPLYHKFTQYSV